MATDKAPSAYGRAVKAQFDAANPAHPAWVSANAGSGKTKVLIDRVARLLLKKASPDSILCITYTKAAANEMLQRLFDRLGAWSVMGEAALRDQLGRLEGRAAETYTSDEIANARALFARAVETPGGLRIETIHAFCARVLRRFPLEADLAPGFEEIDDAEAAVLWEQAVIAGLKTLDAAAPEDLDCVALAGGGRGASSGLQAIGSALPLFTQYLETAETLEAIEANLRRVLSPPESNEETLIARAMGEQMPVTDLKRVIALLKSNSAKSSATLANKLTGVLEARDPQQRWARYQSVFFTTTGDFRKSILVKAVAADPEAGAFLHTDDIPEGSEVLRIKALDAALKARRAYDRTRALLRLAQPVIATYQQLKRVRARVDFDDLIANTADLLTRRAAADWVLYKLDGQLTHVLLDEAQDTSPQQWTLLNALTAEFFAGEGTEKDQALRTLFVVGDEKQSIYSFQGADPQRFLAERQDFEARARSALGEAWLPNMEMSFRSSPEILSFVDTVSASGSVSGHPYVDGPVGDLDLMRHTAHRADQPGLVELWPIEVPDPQTEAIPWDAPRDEESADSPRNRLAVQVAQAVREMIDRGETVWDKGARRPVTAGDVLILVQNRSGGLFDGLIAALKAEKLPVAGADRLVLADHIGVQDCLNLMRFVLLPEDDLVVAEILRGPFGGLVDDNRHLFPLAYDRGEASLWARLKASTVSEHQAVAAFLERLL
ncbi:MAG: UvrD-helicase domain-containing protein, partial [Pseudomonadota bacterium]